MHLITDEKARTVAREQQSVDTMTDCSAGVFVYRCTETGHFVRANAQADIYELVRE